MAKQEIDLVHQISGKKEFMISANEYMEEFYLYELKDNTRTLLKTADNPLKFDSFIATYSKTKK